MTLGRARSAGYTRYFSLNLLAGLAVLAFGLLTTASRGTGYLHWAPNNPPGVAAGFLLAFGSRALPGVVAGALMTPLFFGESALVTAAMAFACVAGGTACAALLRGEPDPLGLLGKPRGILRFLLIAAPAGATVVMAVRVPALIALAREPSIPLGLKLLISWPAAYLHLVLGVPMVLALIPRRGPRSTPAARIWIERCSLVLLPALLVAVVSRIPRASPWAVLYPLLVLAFIPIVMIAFRVGWRGLTLANALLIVAVYGPAAQGRGPFGGVPVELTPAAGVLVAICFSVVSFGVLVLACRQEETQRSLEEARFAAERANHAKSEFLAAMSHELRTPLNALTLGVDLLLQDPLGPEQTEFARTIQRAGDQLRAQIGNVLDQARIEQGQLAFARESVRVREVLEGVREMLAADVARHGLRLALDIDASIDQPLVGDSMRVGQVVLNLVSNAVKFTSRGSVTVRASRISADDGDDLACIEVEDTGIGISLDSQEHIFEPFWQGHASCSESRQGVGLGLSITRQLVKLMGGEIGLRSVPGIGSCFRITLPMRPPVSPAA